jgi:hypothetical protein
MSDQLLVHCGQTFWEAGFKNNPKPHYGRKLAKCIQFSFQAHHRMTLHCMRLTDHVTFNNTISTAVVFFSIKKAFDTMWHPGPPYKMSELEFLTFLIKLIVSFLTNRKFKVSVEGEFSVPRDIVCRSACRFHFFPSIIQFICKLCPHGTWNSSCSICRWYLYICNREAWTLCCQQMTPWPHCHEVMV